MPGRKCHAKFHHARVSADGRAPRLERWMTSLFKEPVSIQLSASSFPQDRWFGRKVTMSEVIMRRKAKPLALVASWLIFCFAFKFLARASGSSTNVPLFRAVISLSLSACVRLRFQRDLAPQPLSSRLSCLPLSRQTTSGYFTRYGEPRRTVFTQPSPEAGKQLTILTLDLPLRLSYQIHSAVRVITSLL